MNSLKKIFSNKNTITILGVILCIIILYIGYTYRINQQTQLVSVPYAKQTIEPRTLITKDMIGHMKVPASFLKGEYYLLDTNIEGKYSSYSSTIVEGSIFYKDLLVKKEDLPDSMFGNIRKGYVVTQFEVDTSTTYANSIMPDNIVNVYFKALQDDGITAVFGKFIKNVKVLAVKDASGNDVFTASEEKRTPAYIFVALPEELFNIINKGKTIPSNSIEFLLVPNTIELKEKNSVELSSEDIKSFIESKTSMIDSNEDIEEIEEISENESNDSEETTN